VGQRQKRLDKVVLDVESVILEKGKAHCGIIYH
jgi:hypothetical protein